MIVYSPPPATYGLAALGLAPPKGIPAFVFTPPPPQFVAPPLGAAMAAMAVGMAAVAGAAAMPHASAGGGGAMVTMSPLQVSVSAGGGGGGVVNSNVWTRHSDGKDIWYSRDANPAEVSWDLPRGAIVHD
jgi:hypothetical protein